MAFGTKINSYNVYWNEKPDKPLGLSAEVTLPDFEALTETLDGAGILGEIDEPVLGRFGASEIEVPFRTMDKAMFDLMNMESSIGLTLRISTQAVIPSSFRTEFLPTRIVIKGKNKGMTTGKLKAGSGSAPAVKIEIMYILIEVQKEKKFELDKINFIYKVNGKDLLQKVKSQI